LLFSVNPGLIAPLIGSGIVLRRLPAVRAARLEVQAGYNWQTGAFVVGIETDIDDGGYRQETFLDVSRYYG
jgi:hypothetical protein